MDINVPNDKDQPLQDSAQPSIDKKSMSKKSNKKLYLIAGAATIGILLIALMGYFAYGYYNPPTTENNTVEQSSDAQTVIETINPTVNAAASTLLGGSISESSITSTDDSSIINDNSTLVENVGDSIDENSF